MNRIRIKTDFTVRWSILTRGEATSLEGRDLRLEMHTPAHVTVQVPFTVEDNVIVVRIAPELQTHVGVYSFTLWENHSKTGQTPLDKCSAFHLVSKTCKADASAADNIEVTPALDLGTDDMVFAPISLGGGSIEIDAELSLESENAVQNKVVAQAIKETQAAADSAMEVAVNAQAAAEDAQETADGKQDKIADLDAIRQGAAKGATALQEEQYKGTYTKPSTGIPKSDLASAVQTSLGKADTALQEHQDISGKLDKTEAADLYQPKGNYQAAGDYATNTALQNEITRATNEEKNIRALAEANKTAIEQLAGVEDGGSVVIVVDPALSETSENPVQNKAVTAGINEAKAAAQTAQNTADEAKTAAGTAEQNAKDYTDDKLGEYAKKTDMPSVPSKVSELTNDAGYITSEDIPAAPDLSGLATKEEVEAVEKKIPTVPTKVSELTNDSGYQTSAQVAAAIANKADKSEIPTVPTNVSAFTNDAGYQKASDVQTAIAGKANTSDIPTKTSELTNDSGFITANDIPDVDTSTLATKTELSQGLDGKVDKVDGKQLSTEDFTTALKEKLAGLSNYDDTAINNAVESLQTQLNTLVSGDANTAIESFNEIIAFLNGIEDSESLDSIIASIEQQIAGKQDAIADLDTIRAGAAKGATALQEHQSLADYAKTADLAKVATSGSYEDLSDKPTIPAEQVNADWNATSGKAQILNKPTIPSKLSELENDGDFLDKTKADELYQAAGLSFTNVEASTWVASTTYEDYAYQCDVACAGVTADDYAEVVFNLTESVSGDYAPLCETLTDAVRIYSKSDATITIPTIIITR